MKPVSSIKGPAWSKATAGVPEELTEEENEPAGGGGGKGDDEICFKH